MYNTCVFVFHNANQEQRAKFLADAAKKKVADGESELIKRCLHIVYVYMYVHMLNEFGKGKCV